MGLTEAERDQLFKVWDKVFNRYLRVQWSSLSEAEQTFYAAWHFEAEVNSGGLESYYFNSGGDHALEAPDALRRIGATQLAAVVEEANSLFPGGPPAEDIDERQERMDALGDDIFSLWEVQDDKVYNRAEPTEEMLWAFYQANKKQFAES